MAPNPFSMPFERLPSILPIFPLADAIVMPRCQLPLNIFEQRYIDMVLDALRAERLIGMVQPDPSGSGEGEPIFRTGTAGRIVSFSETSDGRFLIMLTGVCRFDILEEIPTHHGYRRVLADWTRFRRDYESPSEGIGYDRTRLMALLREYFQRKGFETHWENLEQVPVPLLANVLAGQLPFNPPERQALVETAAPEEIVAKLINLLEFDVVGVMAGDGRQH